MNRRNRMRELAGKAFRVLARYLAVFCVLAPLRHWLLRRSGISIGRKAYVNLGFAPSDGYAPGLIVIEDEVAIGPNVCLIAVSHPNHSFIGREYDVAKTGPVVVRKGAWLGANVVVLPGVVIGTGAIVGAGSVVTRSVPDFAIMVGSPARQIGDVRCKARRGETASRSQTENAA